MQEVIEQMLMEAQRARYSERRTESRHPFVRAVTIFIGDAPGVTAFSRDLSAIGIGVVTELELPVGQIATLRIHSTQGAAVFMRCELRYSDAYGKGWFVTSWKFLNVASMPSASARR